MKPIYEFNGKDITMNVIIQLKQIVKIIQSRFDLDFESAVMQFYWSKTYVVLQQVENTLWAESAGYIADRYFEEVERDPSTFNEVTEYIEKLKAEELARACESDGASRADQTANE